MTIETGFNTYNCRHVLGILRDRIPPVYVPVESEPVIGHIGNSIWDKISDPIRSTINSIQDEWQNPFDPSDLLLTLAGQDK